MKYFLSTYLLLALLVLTVLPSAAEEVEPGRGRGWHGRHKADEMGPRPFGDYCLRRHADHYGARQPLQTADEAKERLRIFFNVPAAQISLHREIRMGYIADITNADGSLLDRVIIDKRTGRIRSTR
ncbi:hypothetical protein [Trichlorobacter lovleyi]|uniref:PepSY domain-containing protein n=1 Tax=Trichlorobacter lovleyi (strain ATCC BAA-1151 / DSM 17278 / SZ) TaxID=398767 RepID=B3E8G3_TRIL1|nr:hypothetical protein [Trichlorobacter lovleyi]ACD96639.1 hypothetical protein Glov_2932 [Trichlorobacter lovleyi SZ]